MGSFHPSKNKYEELSLYLTEAFLFMNQYEWISNSYVAEFFAQDLWNKLPPQWRECLEGVSLKEVACNILKNDQNKTYSSVWPLSLLSFVATCHALALNRQQIVLPQKIVPSELSNVFKKHIKPKKRHELSVLPELIHSTCEKTGTKNIVDVGSGLGHLARFLAYKYGYNVTAIEMTSQRLPVAEKFDKEMEMELQRIGKTCKSSFGTVRHVAKRIDADISSEEFCSLINSSEDTQCILIGLHTCGDLASTMLKVFRNTRSICGLVSVSCCYFKMTLKEFTGDEFHKHIINDSNEILASSDEDEKQESIVLNDKVAIKDVDKNFGPGSSSSIHLKTLYSNFSLESFNKLVGNNFQTTDSCHMNACPRDTCHEKSTEGFPMSTFLRNIPCQPLKYKSFETACHFIDDYSQKLLDNSPNLKLHCYRAVMEVLLRKINPAFVLTAVRCKKIKNAAAMCFSEYAENVIRRVTDDFDPSVLELIDCNQLLSQWKNVAIYHSLSLLLGPIIESIALVDKWMFLLESKFNVSLLPLFDPKISPRNFVVVATKDKFITTVNGNSDILETS